MEVAKHTWVDKNNVAAVRDYLLHQKTVLFDTEFHIHHRIIELVTLCLVNREIYVLDTTHPDAMQLARQILENDRIKKWVWHVEFDRKIWASNGINSQNVEDLQLRTRCTLERRPSLALYRPILHHDAVKVRMKMKERLFHQRPLPRILLEYSVSGMQACFVAAKDLGAI